MMSTAKRYPATEEKTTLKDKPIFVSCLRSVNSVFLMSLVSVITVESIRFQIECKDI